MKITRVPRPPPVPIAKQAAYWLRLFRDGVFEDNFLDVSGLDAGAWERARAELEQAATLAVERDVLLAGRPYLRLIEKKEPGSPPGRARLVEAAVRARYVEVYRSLMMAVRQAFHGPRPKQGMEILELEEANFRRAVAWARDLGDAKAAEMGDLFTRYLDRAGRTEERDRWVAWLAGEGLDEVATAPVEEIEEEAPAPVAVAERATAHAAPEPPPPVMEAAPAQEQEQETEGARLQREGKAAVAEGQIAQATDLYLRAMQWFQSARDAAGVAATCELFGAMEEAAGRPDAARVWYERAGAKRGATSPAP